MISKNLINIIINNADKKNLGVLVAELINHFDVTYDPYDRKTNNVLEIISGTKPIRKSDISIDNIIANKDKIFYNTKVIDNTISIQCVDNIEGIIRVTYQYETENGEIYSSSIGIDIFEYPVVLNKS